MAALLTLLTIAAIIQPSFGCMQGYSTLYNGYCMRFSGWYEVLSNGLKDCKKDGTHAPVVRSQADNDLMVQMDGVYGGKNSLLLGIVCNKQKGILEWVDGTAITYTNFKKDTPLSCKSDKSYCIDIATKKWVEVGTFTIVDLFCQETKQLQDGNCAANYHPITTSMGDSGYCYKMTSTQSSMYWQRAEDICFQDYAHLPIIHSQDVNDFLRRTAVGNGATSSFLIGLHRQNNSNYFGWEDGSSLNFMNYQSGYPANGYGDCGAMNVNGGQWINTGCDRDLPYICMQDAIGHGTVTPPTCSGATMFNSGAISSPGFPWNANIPCNFILQANNGYHIELEIVFLEANECCDVLEINDGPDGVSVIKKMSGAGWTGYKVSSTKNAMRVRWNPDGGVGVKGFTAKFRSVPN